MGAEDNWQDWLLRVGANYLRKASSGEALVGRGILKSGNWHVGKPGGKQSLGWGHLGARGLDIAL